MKVTIYVEGGGDDNNKQLKCCKGFRTFFEKATFKERMFKIIVCGGRQQAYNNFCTALDHPKSGEFPILLVDSEELVTAASKWDHLRNRKGDEWNRPGKATEDHVYLMIVCMEAWFMADKEALKKYYDQDFNSNVLPKNSNIEEISKKDLMSKLEQATTKTQKGKYSKGQHSFSILAEINPEKVMKASPQVEKMINDLKNKMDCKSV